MRDILRRYQPDRIEDLIALNALYRPGPMGMIDDFIDRKHGRKEVVYDLPVMKEILEETFGVMVYQEQVMQIANRVAGYSLGEADLLRRAMGKKKAEEMAKQRARFVEGAAKNNHPARKVEKVFDLMEKFAGYGFNKSHSAAYAFLALVTGYLKAHYPLEFMSALLTSEAGNTAKVVKYINECREMGIQVLAPDVNASAFTFTPAPDGIRFGLGAIKNVGANAVESIIKARTEGGKFTSLYDFCERVDLSAVNRRMIESFIKAGALDSLGAARAQLFAVIDGAMEIGTRAQKDRASGQSGLFADLAAQEPAAARPLPTVPDWTPKEKLAGEKEMLGFYITGHPLDQFMEKWESSPRTSLRAWKGCRRTRKSRCAAFSPASSASGIRKASCGRRCRSRIRKAAWRRWCSPPSTNACCRSSTKIRPCWCAGWCCPRRTRRPRSRCRTSCCWKMPACGSRRSSRFAFR